MHTAAAYICEKQNWRLNCCVALDLVIDKFQHLGERLILHNIKGDTPQSVVNVKKKETAA